MSAEAAPVACVRSAALAAVLLAASPVGAADRPLWELGAGVGVLSLPSWRGSDVTRAYVLPVPYFTYHGEFLRADRRGIRGVLFDSERIDLGISLSASPPVGSAHGSARDGMPELKASGEIGPQLDLSLWRSADHTRNLRLILPLRAAFTLSGSPDPIGWIFSPAVNLDVADMDALPGWKLGLRTGPIFATRRQHEYFYEVTAAQATATRPAYAARGGYSGSQFLAALSKRFPSYWVGSYLRYDNLQGAVFEDSPLVSRNHYLAAGVAVAWIIGESSERAKVDED